MDAGLETVVAIETPEQIALEVEIAGIGSRFVAYALDLLWQSLVLVIAFVGALAIASAQGVALTSKNPRDLFLTRWSVALLSLSFFVVNFGYFTLFEMLWRGQTPGKRRVGLRVIREGGYPLNFTASFLRNLLRIVDFLPVGYAVGVTVAVLGSRWQRIGDLAARTWVVREHPDGPGRLRIEPDSDGRLAADYESRVPGFQREADNALASTLAAHIASRRHEPAPAQPWAYLSAVASEAVA
jgi:uncharacterized RDD family membrane protein YckC